MSDRSQDLAKQFKAKKDAEQLANEEEQIRNRKILRDEETLKREAPEIWKGLRTEFRKQIEELNAEPEIGNILALDEKVKNTITITRTDEHRIMRVSYNEPSREITLSTLYTPVGVTAKLRIGIRAGDSDPSVIDEHGRPVNMSSVVDSYLRGLLGLA